MNRPLAVVRLVLLAVFCTTTATEGLAAAPVDLSAAERNVFSQSGEDGVLEKIFERIEPTSKYAVEFGASNGVKNSNVRNLIVNEDWAGLQIEGDEEKARELKKNYADYPKAQCKQAWVYPGNIELLFEEAGVPKDLDLLIIDIDSNDYYVWRAIREYRPKVVIIEINPFFPPPERMVVEFHPMNYWDKSDYYGASLQSLYELGQKKGYELVYVNKMGNNAFFLDKPYFERLGVEDNSPASLYRPPPSFLWSAVGRDPENPEAPAAASSKPLHWDAFDIPKVYRSDR